MDNIKSTSDILKKWGQEEFDRMIVEAGALRAPQLLMREMEDITIDDLHQLFVRKLNMSIFTEGEISKNVNMFKKTLKKYKHIADENYGEYKESYKSSADGILPPTEYQSSIESCINRAHRFGIPCDENGKRWDAQHPQN
jgi:hypothetical protein